MDSKVDNQTCPAVGYQTLSVCVPVMVEPFAKAGATVTKCCGEPVINDCDSMCKGKKKGVCSFTVTQDICVEVPIHFGATTTVGDTYVECKEIKDMCCGTSQTTQTTQVTQ
jgi:hypothetical protein